MRILRLRLEHFKGVEKAELRFRPQGLNVIEGPNEAGKTSVVEALHLIFDYLDDSKHAKVKSTKPKHRDAGTEIEIEAESGPYAFRYLKCFHKGRRTELAVARPRTETHTGREAHERAAKILEETIDVDLWRALGSLQGESLMQADLGKQTALSAALDRAAGGGASDPLAESIFEAAAKEYSLYYTGEKGAEKKDLADKAEVERRAAEQEEALRRQQEDLERDVERAARLEAEIAQLAARERELEAEAEKRAKALEEIRGLDEDVKGRERESESARKSLEMARGALEAREALVARIEEARRSQAALEEKERSQAEALGRREEELARAAGAASAADERRRRAESLLKLRRDDFDHFNDALHLEQLRERQQRIEEARREAAQDEAMLAKLRIDPAKLKAIEAAAQEQAIARAQLDANAPSLRLRAPAPLALEIDGAAAALAGGEVRDIPVSDRLRVRVPGVIEIEAAAGTSNEELRRKQAAADRALDRALEAAGAASAAEARGLEDERRAARARLERRDQVERENLRDLSYDDLARRVTELGVRVPEYRKSRAPEPAIGPDLESAARLRNEAEAELREADRGARAAQAALEKAREIRDEARGGSRELRVERDLNAGALARLSAEIDTARAAVPDERLREERDRCAGELGRLEDVLRQARDRLAAKQPEAARELARTALASLERARKDRVAAAEDLASVRGGLAARGEDGLHEKLQAAASALARARREHAAVRRRAGAARLLFETLREERDRAREAYVAPLQQRIEQLGRILFDDSFHVTLSKDLAIESRTLGGLPMPFELLSGGAQEQLALITRLACAMLVAKDGGGAPLIVDDALAYTDPERLKRMGAVLSRAARECQVIVLTCVPERYAHVGEAEVIRLQAAAKTTEDR